MDIDRLATGEQFDDRPPTIPRQSAAIILLRDWSDGVELLLVRRNPAQRFMGGYWVFPGGAVDARDGEGDAGHRAAAVRELREEAAVDAVDPAGLVKFSRWITPELLKIRFDTHFFLARAPEGVEARCDGRECVGVRWGSPRGLLGAHEQGALALAFPTLRQLEQLSAFDRVEALLSHARRQRIPPMRPRAVRSGEITRLVLPGEPGYGAPDVSADDGSP
jgi:8-oxo-dGTP pyrophosphatase MutT (NUDIX family)